MERQRIQRLRQAILKYYRDHQRELPWRRTRDPYAIWISEVMLQQTRVDTVIPYYHRFLARWPTVKALADADPEAVRAVWSGLGYYRRAELMMKAAGVVARDHDGRFPPEQKELEQLPGMGRYTSGAVASIAFDRSVPAVDGNVLRLLARVEMIEGDVTRGAPNRSVWGAARELAKGDHPGELNQGLIELGAQVCTPRKPKCETCPLARDCHARQNGATHRIPPVRKRPSRRTVEVTGLILLDPAGVLLERQPEQGLFGGLWCLPMLEGKLEPDAIQDEAGRKYGLEIWEVESILEVKHILTHREIQMRVATIKARSERPATPTLRFIALEQLPELGIPTATVRALQAGLPEALLASANLPERKTRRSRQNLFEIPSRRA